MIDLLQTFRALAAFQPARVDLKSADWDGYVDWAIGNGLAPLAAYNLEYRLAGGGAPEWVRDRLMSVYQGTLNDNVMKLVNFKRAVDELEGRQIILLGAASYAEALYPHVAFRPVLELELLVRGTDVDAFSSFLGNSDFKPELEAAPSQATKTLSDGRTQVLLFADLLGPGRRALESEIFERAIPMRVYGPSLFRLDLEDAILVICLEHARAGYELPLITFVDLRELLLGAPSLGGPYSRAPDFEVLRARARAWRIERALYSSVSVVERLFPDARAATEHAKPELRLATRQLLDRLVVAPASDLGKVRRIKGADRLRRLLTGA